MSETDKYPQLYLEVEGKTGGGGGGGGGGNRKVTGELEKVRKALHPTKVSSFHCVVIEKRRAIKSSFLYLGALLLFYLADE